MMKMLTRRFYKNFKTIEKEFIGKPINYLEIGVFLGSTSEFMINNILTHIDSRYYGIDPWEWFKPMHRRFPTEAEWHEKVIEPIAVMREKYKDKAEFIKGYSQDILMLPRWKKQLMDIVYIDGHHSTLSVLRDFVLTWPLLKKGGVMVFDDYLQGHSTEVKDAVDIILKGLGDRKLRADNTINRNAKYELLWKNYAVGIRKVVE